MILPGLLTFTILADYVWAVVVAEVILIVTIMVLTLAHYHQKINLLNVCYKFSKSGHNSYLWCMILACLQESVQNDKSLFCNVDYLYYLWGCGYFA